MKYIQIAGFMPAKIKAPKELKFVASPSIDIEKMEAEEITGFDFTMSNTVFDKFYQTDDYEVMVTDDLSTTDTVIAVDDSSYFTVNDYVWLKSEVIKIVSINTSTQITVLRGQYNTFAQKYTVNTDTEQYYYIRKYPKTFIGQRVFLYENNKLLSIGLIKEQPVFNNSLLSFNCVNAIESLDVDWTIPASSDLTGLAAANTGDERAEAISVLNLNKAFGVNKDSSFAYEMPPIMDYMRIPLSENLMQGSSLSTWIFLNDLGTLLEYLNLYGKVNASVFTWDYTEEVYTFMNISDVTTLDTVTNVTLASYKDITKSYSSQAYTGISQISVKLWNTVININNTNTSQFANKDVFEIDLSKIYGVKPSDINSIIFYYIRLFSIIYSELTIPTHAIKFQDFTEGFFYNILDIDKFYTFQDVSSRAFCLSKDENNIKFLITREVEKNMISPALTGSIVATNQFEHDNTIQDFLETTEDNVEDAEIARYNYKYFEVGDKVMFVKDNGTKTAGLTITSIASNTITVSPSSLTISDTGYFTFDNYSVCNARQKLYFFLNVNNW